MTPTLRRRFLHAVVCAALAAAAFPAVAGDLPPGVEARVYDRDITEDALLDRLARRFENTDNGKQVRDQLVEDLCVAKEAERRGVTVTEAEARKYMAKLDAKIRADTAGAKSLRNVFEEEDSTEEEFLRIALDFLLRQKMAAKDMGIKVDPDRPADPRRLDGEVSDWKMKLWLKSLRTRIGVKLDGLPDGVIAEVGGEPIRRKALAKHLRDRLPPESVRATLDDLVLEAAAAREMELADLELQPADLAAELGRLRTRFEEDPRVRGAEITFDQFLRQTMGFGEAELTQDPNFRARLGLRKLEERKITEQVLVSHWETHAAAYGERAMVRQIYFAAARKDDDRFEQLHTPKQAYDLALRAKLAVLKRTGLTSRPDPDRSSQPLPDAVTAVAKRFETDEAKRQQAGEPTVWTRATVAGERDLERLVFEGDLGELHGPVRTSVGYHLLVVEQRRPAPKFAEIRHVVRDDVLRERTRRYLLALKSDDNVIFATGR